MTRTFSLLLPAATLIWLSVLLCLATDARAGSYYRLGTVTQASELLARLDRQVEADRDPLRFDIDALSGQLRDVALALHLVRGSTDEADLAAAEAWMTTQRRALAEQSDLIDARVDVIESKARKAFLEAVQRAAAEIDARGMGPIVACSPDAETCSGRDYSRRVASLADLDPDFIEALEGLPGGGWPALTRPDPAVVVAIPMGRKREGADPCRDCASISPAVLARAVPEVAAVLNAVSSADGDSASQEAAYRRVGDALCAAVDRVRNKGKREGWADARACLNPALAGGCGDGDATEDVSWYLERERKLSSEMQAILKDLGAR